jgi:4-hydroxy-3-methylbut-2-enyl diphosphate reductase
VRAEPLVLAPLRIEALALRGAGRVVRVGKGRQSAERAAVALRAPGPVVVAGVAGGLLDDLEPGDLVVASEVQGPEGSVACPAAAPLVAALRRSGARVWHGPLLTTDHIVRDGERAALASSTGAIAVDMESALVAPLARGRPFASVRAIVDVPGRDLRRPLATAAGGIRALRALAHSTPAFRSWAAAAGPRRVVLAAPRSFCAGVERAIEIVERALERHGPPVYVRKQIVHNIHVVRDLENRGAIFVESESEVPPGAVCIFSAHGVSPEVRANARARELQVIDATCPLVTKVHAEARRFAAKEHTVVLVGHLGHEEVEGTMGEAPASIRVVENVEDAEALDVPDPSRVAFVTQTTLAVSETTGIVAALRRRFPELKGPHSEDICYATQNRQDAVEALVRDCDLLLVIGSDNSSNSKRLVEVAERDGCAARLVNDETEIDPEWLAGVETVGITAGASAPESLVQRAIATLRGLGEIHVSEREGVTESIRFTLPREVR